MNDWQVRQIVLAIRAHARAMVAATLATSPLGPGESWASDEAQMEWAQKYADDLLAALSASSGPSRGWLARMGDAEAGCQVTAAGLAADVGLVSESSASSGGENDTADGATGADTALAQGAEVTAEGPSGVRKTEPNAQAATPPLSADLVTVRRDDLAWVVAVLSIHGECTTRWNRLRDAVSR